MTLNRPLHLILMLLLAIAVAGCSSTGDEKGRWLLQGRRSRRESAVQPGPGARRGAAHRALRQRREPALRGVRPALRARHHRPALSQAGHRVLVRQEIPRQLHVDRRALRHVRHDGGPHHAAGAQLRPGDQPGQRPHRDRARQRSRPVPQRPHHGPVLRGGLQAGHHRPGQRPGGGGKHRRGRDPAPGLARPRRPAAPAVVGHGLAAGGRAGRRGPGRADAGGAAGHAAAGRPTPPAASATSICRWARSASRPMRRRWSAASMRSWARKARRPP